MHLLAVERTHFAQQDFDDIDWDGVANDDEREMSTLHPKRRQETKVHFSFGSFLRCFSRLNVQILIGVRDSPALGPFLGRVG